MKITNLIVPIAVLTTLNNPNNQVQAVQVEWEMPVNHNACYEGCVNAHSIAAKACCAGIYFPPAFVACQLAASAGLALCIGLCNQ